MVTMRSSVGMNDESTLSVVVLPAPVLPDTTTLSRPRTQASRKSRDVRLSDAEAHQVLGGEGVGGELADGQDGAVDGQRRHDGVDARPVGQPGVDHRARLVDATADPRHDLVDRAAQVVLVGEPGVHRGQPAVALDEDAVGAVDHDLGDVGVVQVGLDRPVADDVVADLLGDPEPVARAQRPLLGGEHVGEDGAQLLVELVLVEVGLVELRAERS